MTKELRFGWMNIGVAVILIASSIVVFVTESVGTQQLVLQAFLFVCAVGLLARGVSRVVTARRR